MQSQLDPQEILDECEDLYQDAYHDIAKRDRDGLVLSDLQQDLIKMSNQPAIKYEFRRFVILKSTGDVHGRPGEADWVSNLMASLLSLRDSRLHYFQCEWKFVSEFRFGDEVET